MSDDEEDTPTPPSNRFCPATHPKDPRVVCHVMRGDGPLGHDPYDDWPLNMGYDSPGPHLGFGPWAAVRPVAWGDPVRPVRSAPGVNGRIKRPKPRRAIEAGR